VLCAAAVSALTVNSENVETVFKFQAWMEQFGKKYDTAASYDHAYHNFVASLKRIASKHSHGGKTQWGLTKFSDLSQAEFEHFYLTAKPQKHKGPINVVKPKKQHPAADMVDWRTKGAVSPVKDQAQCGSCWAFSTTEEFESMTFIKTGKMPILGPQQLVDCDPQSQGCGGGWTYWAWQYLLSAGGQETEANYPYMAVNQPCKFDKMKIAAKLTNFTYPIPPCEQGDCSGQAAMEGDLQTAIAKTGPMSICVNAQTWNDYQGGVMTGDSCSGAAGGIDHCVQLVGYDLSGGSLGTPYYMVRNSWNTNWGDNGYIYLEIGKNTCALADVVTYADIPASRK